MMIRKQERGSLMILVPITLVMAVGLIIATLTLSTTNQRDAHRETRKIQAYYLAKAGLEQQVYDFKQMTKSAVLVDPFSGIEAFHDKKTYLDSIKMLPNPAPPAQLPLVIDGEPVNAMASFVDGGILPAGTFDVSIHVEGYDPDAPDALSGSRRFVTIRSTGWSPHRDAPNAESHTVESTILVELSASDVFDYAYFINNWGWFYGDTIQANGNVRSNGQFDATDGGVAYSPTINGTPRYLGSNGNDLFGYIDDNGDGTKDGSDGGVYAGWGIDGSGLQGMVSTTDDAGALINQHAHDGYVDMPNLTDLTIYENHGKANNASVSVGGVQMTDAVYGDNPGETGNIVLIGTTADPIEINGTVVVRGSVIISGVVSGQGVIYAGGNVYVADDVTYANPPTSPRPVGSSEAEFESWMASNSGADALGLFAREHIVLGDPGHSWFNYYVEPWMSDPRNRSDEDAGTDLIANTAYGVDGIPFTEDDDVLEDDGEWTVEHYSQAHEYLGLIPDGSAVGDVIPGTGEDIDGDGVQDGPTQMSEFGLPAALDSGQWGGNLPPGTTNFSDIASVYIAEINAAMYTNHTLAGLTLNWGSDIQINGCLVSRNEALVYGADSLQINHDARLIGGGDNFGFYLPRTFKQIKTMRFVDSVPRRHFDADTIDAAQGYGSTILDQ